MRLEISYLLYFQAQIQTYIHIYPLIMMGKTKFLDEKIL